MIDLHLHTSLSDGRNPPAELVRLCLAAGLRTISVTDHDTTAAWPEAAAATARAGIEFVPGIEITAVLDGNDVHVLGYFPVLRAPLLDGFLADQRADRVRRVRRMARRLTDLGLPIDMDAEIGAAERDPSRTIGRPHVADALVRAGHCVDRTEAFDKYIGEGCPAFIPRQGATPEDVIELIMGAGGLASLAHPALLGRDEIIPMLIAAGLPAIEVYHSEHDEFDRQRYRRAAEKSNLLCTGGSDYHGEESGRPVALGSVTLPAAEFERFRDRLFA